MRSAPLGAGGMGEVYKATDTRLGRTVAVKILPAGLAADPEFRQRFDREAKAISQLTHPHICTLYDVGEHEGTARSSRCATRKPGAAGRGPTMTRSSFRHRRQTTLVRHHARTAV